MKSLARFELSGKVAEPPTPMVNVDGSSEFYEVQITTPGKKAPNFYNVSYFDKVLFDAIQKLKPGDFIHTTGSINGRKYKGFFNVNFYGDNIYKSIAEKSNYTPKPKPANNDMNEEDIPF